MYPTGIVNMAREYIDFVDMENSGRYDGLGVTTIEMERRGLHKTLNSYLCAHWKRKEVTDIGEMYNLCQRIIMGSNMGGR